MLDGVLTPLAAIVSVNREDQSMSRLHI